MLRPVPEEARDWPAELSKQNRAYLAAAAVGGLCANIQSKIILTSSPVLIMPKAILGAGGSILKSVILREAVPEILSFFSPSGTTLMGIVIEFVTPPTARSPLASNT